MSEIRIILDYKSGEDGSAAIKTKITGNGSAMDLHRAYVALGGAIHKETCKKLYGDEKEQEKITNKYFDE